MGQLTIYLPDEVEKRFRLEALRAKRSVSAYIASLAEPQKHGAHGWPKGFEDLFGSLKGALKAPDDVPPEVPRLGSSLPVGHRRVRRLPERR